MPHINAVMKHIPSQFLALGTTKVAGEACTLGGIFRGHGQYKQAGELYECAVAGYEKVFGINHSDTLTAVHNMALVFDTASSVWIGPASPAVKKAHAGLDRVKLGRGLA